MLKQAPGGYTNKVDAWSLGVVAFMMLTGSPPFPGRSDKTILEAVKRGVFKPTSAKWARLSASAKDFVQRLLDARPAHRVSVTDALRHPWLAAARDVVESAPLPLSLVSAMRRFSALRGWERTVLEAVAFTVTERGGSFRHDESLTDVRAAFQKIDVRGDGHVSPAVLAGSVTSGAGISARDADALLGACFPASRKSISYSHFLAATLPRRDLTRGALLDAFNALDTEGRGFLTREGMQRAVGGDFDAARLDDLFAAGAGRVAFEPFYESFMRRVVNDGEQLSPDMSVLVDVAEEPAELEDEPSSSGELARAARSGGSDNYELHDDAHDDHAHPPYPPLPTPVKASAPAPPPDLHDAYASAMADSAHDTYADAMAESAPAARADAYAAAAAPPAQDLHDAYGSALDF